MEIIRRTRGINIFYEAVVEEEGYITEMLANNHFRYLPPLAVRQREEGCLLLYKIDGLQSFAACFRRRGPGWTEIERLVRDIAAAIRELQEYLLPPEGLRLSTEYLLYDEAAVRYRFLYTGHSENDFAGQMKSLFEEVIPWFSHEKREDAVRFYDLYGRFLNDSFTPEMLLTIVDGWAGESSGERNGFADLSGGCAYTEQGIAARTGDLIRTGDPIRTGDSVQTGERRALLSGREPGASPVKEDPEKEDKWFWIGLGGAVLVIALILILSGGKAVVPAVILGAVAVGTLVLRAMLKDKPEEACGEDRAGRGGLIEVQDLSYPEENREAGPEGPPAWTGTMLTRLVPAENDGRRPIDLSEGYCRIGRAPEENEYCISAPGISRSHACLTCADGVVTLQDMHSTNGTYVNRERVEEAGVRELHYGDVVSFAGEEYYCV